MAKRGRPKGSKNKKKVSKSGAAWHKAMMAAKAAKHGGKKRGKKTATRAASSPGPTLGLLEKIDKKVTRIDRTVNAGYHLAKKAKRHAHRNALSGAYEEAERSGELYE